MDKIDRIVGHAKRRIKAERHKVALLDSIIEKTLKEVENGKKDRSKKSNIRQRGKN
tara:strand:- start:280 stop:447 length:168 start_codon:yes stop_codon:yes gene_type:complete